MQNFSETTTEVSIDEITVNNKYLRLNTQIEDLKKSIKTIGVINPLVVNDKLELIAGARRYCALKELGFKQVPIKIVKKNALEQELISIDENLVRKPLTKIEMETCLKRGLELYEELFPEAKKVNLDTANLTKEQQKIIEQEELEDDTSYLAHTADKIGLSKSVIKNAIKRESFSSDGLKEMRQAGVLSATAANELIKLEKKQQEEVLPIIEGKTVKEIKKIIKDVKDHGVQEAIETANDEIRPPKELEDFIKMTKKLKKSCNKLLIEESLIEYHHEAINKELTGLMGLFQKMINLEDTENTEELDQYPINATEDFQEAEAQIQ